MKFFHDINGNIHPISAIVKIGKAREITYRDSKRKANVYPVDLADEQQCEISEFDHRHIMDSPVHLLPAEPGTFMLQSIGAADDEDDSPWQTPLIAWAYTADGNLVPYTADGANDGLDCSGPILYPSGLVSEIGGASWRTYDDYLAHQRAERDGKLT